MIIFRLKSTVRSVSINLLTGQFDKCEVSWDDGAEISYVVKYKRRLN